MLLFVFLTVILLTTAVPIQKPLISNENRRTQKDASAFCQFVCHNTRFIDGDVAGSMKLLRNYFSLR